MLFRFSLYGFLKNLRFFEPFLVLYFLFRGLNFLQIGFLIAFREIVINILEIPAGTFADIYGKKRSMIFSFFAYIISFLIFSLFDGYALFFVAFTFFGLGDAFRTGTHKAIIFDYLKSRGIGDQKTRVYGYTRSWSKLGSALSAVIAATIMFFTQDYSIVFWASIIPYILNIINFLGYPEDRITSPKKLNLAGFIAELKDSFKLLFSQKPLRNLLLTTMTYEGVFSITKEYLQPIIKAFALALPIFLYFDNHKRTALLIGLIYVIVNLVSSFFSRKSYRFVKKENKHTMKTLVILTLSAHLLIAVFLRIEFQIIPLILMVFLYAFQNIWRPIAISEVNELSPQEKTVTILSVESQSKSLFLFIFAPLFGFLIDKTGLYMIGVLSPLFLLVTLCLLGRKSDR